MIHKKGAHTLTSTNYAGKFAPGSVFLTTSCGELKVIAKAPRFRRAPLYLVEFLNTGYRRYARGDAISSGNVKDRMSPSVCGVGYLGTDEEVNHQPEYKLWVSVLNRCYGDASINRTYNKVTVCKDWLCYATFLNDVRGLPNYDNWLDFKGWQLDKDTLGGIEYSKETCTFITAEENSREAQYRKADYVRGLEEEVLRLQEMVKRINNETN